MDKSSGLNTVIHEVVEMALLEAGFGDVSHMYAFMVETELYPGSIIVKLADYDVSHLEDIISKGVSLS